MRFLVFATDYDGTLATGGTVDAATRSAIAEVKSSGRRLVLVTGRTLPDLERVFPELDLFDAIVAENGALVYLCAEKRTIALAEPPPATFRRALEARGISDLATGQVILATRRPSETTVLEVIRDQRLELQVIFNKDAVMVVPSGVDKGVGLRAALAELGLSLRNTVAVGDAENDHAFLQVSECAVALADALPSLKARADWVTPSGNGAGVRELAAQLLEDDLAKVAHRSSTKSTTCSLRIDVSRRRARRTSPAS